MAAGITGESTLATLMPEAVQPVRSAHLLKQQVVMASSDSLSRWLLSQMHPALLDSVPGIDPGALPEPSSGPEPDPDPDPLPPSVPGNLGVDPGFPIEPLPSPVPVTLG
jgi:hypothetical protein